MDTYDLQFPIKHPKYVIADIGYEKELYKSLKTVFFNRIEGIIRRIIFAEKGERKQLWNKFLKKVGMKK